MLRKFLCLALMAAALTLAGASRAHAWGALHVGYTRVGPYGVEHYGRTVGVGPYGGLYSGGRYGAYGAYGARYGSVYHYGYSPYGYGAYARYGGFYRGW